MAKKLKNNVIGFSRRQGSGHRPEWELVQSFLGQQHAPATRKMYRSSFGKFARWCGERDLEPLCARGLFALARYATPKITFGCFRRASTRLESGHSSGMKKPAIIL